MIKKILIAPFLALIFVYRNFISPLTPATCRYTPSCSSYAQQALKKYGIFKGGFFAVKRIFSCHPWGGSGYDPIP